MWLKILWVIIIVIIYCTILIRIDNKIQLSYARVLYIYCTYLNLS